MYQLPNPLKVSCAIILQDDKILVVQRSATMSHPLKWEFPGGKIESGETPFQALQREILEELSIEIHLIQALSSYLHIYPNITVELYPFIVKISKGEVHLLEHQSMQWLNKEELIELDWVEADIAIVKDIVNL